MVMIMTSYLTMQCNEWPWQVGIVSREGSLVSTSPFCGGTLVNKKYSSLYPPTSILIMYL